MELNLVRQIIAEQLNISVDSITEDTVFEDLGADSLDVFQIIAALEEEMSVELELDDTEPIKTVGDIVRHIKEQN